MRKNRNGFTLTETLLTITILVILFSLAVPAVFSLQKNLRQKELDDKAQIIYTAAQNRLTELYTSGRSDLYNPSLHDDIYKMDNYPGDYDDTIDGNKLTVDSVYFVTSGSGIGRQLFEDVFDESLYDEHWVIEIIPYVIDENDNSKQITAATVYAVYYSEDVVSVNEDYHSGGSINSTYLNTYRFKNVRLASVSKGGTNARVGYYGGSSLGSSSGTTDLAISLVKINSNDEIETAVVKAKKPGNVTEKAMFTFKLSDAYGHSYTITYDDVTKRFVANNIDITDKNTIKVSRVGVNFEFTFTLDDLSSESTRFTNLYGEKSGHDKNNLVSGSDIKLEATIASEDKLASADTKYDVGNSLFAYDADLNVVSKKDYAQISCVRHLQNLDSSSNVTSDIKRATLLNDISLKEDGDFDSEYSGKYFNGFIKTNKISTSGSIGSVNNVNFKGITNDFLENFDGCNFTIFNLTTSSGGLFNSANNTLTISNLKLVGEKINSTDDAGGFIGTITSSGKVTIENSSSYLSSVNNDIPSVITSDMNLESFRFIEGNVVGGLVGTNYGSLTIKDCFSSSILGKIGSTTGGLVGINNGTITINKAYSDSYLYGLNVGGLVGVNNNNLTISDAYAAGFIGLDNDSNSLGAGISLGSVNKAEDLYTIIACYNVDDDNGIKKNSDDPFVGKYYSTFNSAKNIDNLYYLRGSTNDNDNIGVAVTDGKDMKFSSDSSLAINSSLLTTPYKLMGQSLTSYTYPRFSDLEHHGDWDVNFVSGALVYYEQYKKSDGTYYYGFDGAGVDISLSGNDTIYGDGYGVIVKESQSSIPKSFEVTVNGTTKTINTDNDTYYSVTKYNEIYRIYPLSKDLINVEKAVGYYYQRVSIASNNETKYFDFNPHFARTVVDVDSESSETSAIPSEISIRSPRQLYNLSKYYDNGYKTIVGDKIYRQERDILYSSYDWNNFSNVSSVSSQEPIGKTSDTTFSATYDGGSYTIGDLSFISESGYYIGMFGYSTGTIKNVVLATQYNKDGNSYRVSRSNSASTNETVYYGILVGKNSGTISNSAIAGYYLSGKDGTIHGYANSTIYLGGLVGYNDGTITDCAADSPKTSLTMYRATCYAGGLVGYNTGNIRNSYALNHISSDATEGSTIIAGFVAYNSGSINQSYCATVLTSSGTGSYAYAFSPKGDGGSINQSYYLYNGSYEFVDGLYAYEGNDASTEGIGRKYKQLKDMRGNRIAKSSKYNALTKQLDSSETVYPYRAVIKDASGNYVHYGEWQVKPNLGVFGVFYWEKEENGQNNGYKITYVGTNYGEINYHSTLCESHDDGGEITEYGYGYYVGEDYDDDNLKISTNDDIEMSDNNNINVNAKNAFESQIEGVHFYPHTTRYSTTGDYIYLSGEGSNGTITLTKDDETYTFNISPFFANAISLQTTKTSNDADALKHINTTPGLSENPYEIRSAIQLQFINWNYGLKSNSELVTDSNYKKYNYLLYATVIDAGYQTLNSAGNNVAANYVFKQSHDLNASNISNFSPIAGQGSGTSSKANSYTAKLYAWFGGTYDGQSYKIQELNINSKSYSVGLFGVTVGAEIDNTILYSTKGAKIIRETENTDEEGSYSIGGLIGLAYDYQNSSNRTITNCAIAGYKIIDNSKNQQGLGEANVGGLIGVSNADINKCSAVTDIEINCTHINTSGSFTKAEWGNFIRVGGLSGAVQNRVTNSYTGGSIKVGSDTLDETYNSSNKKVSQNSKSYANVNNSTNIYLSGIAGSGFTMNYINFTNNIYGVSDGKPDISNCYTYMIFPKMEGTIRSITMFASVADRYQQEGAYVTIKNCYYLNTSADIDTSNLPSYYFTYSRFNNIYVNSAMTNELKEKMILGNSNWMRKVFNNNDNDDSNKISITTASASKDFTSLSDKSMLDSLSSFTFVSTTDESGQVIDGRYSFPAGYTSLEGKNYPFPTIITQDNGTVNVHYGEWPFASAYWENGVDTLDIFANIDLNDTSAQEPYAYKEFVLHKNNADISDLKFSIDGSYVEIVENDDGSLYRINDNGDYVIKLRALKTGTSIITATWGDKDESSAQFTLTVTANLTVSADPNKIAVANEEKVSSNLIATSKEKETNDFSKKVIWNVTVSTKVSSDGDAGINLDGDKCEITGYGVNAQVNVSATYNYHGETYSASTVIDVLRESSVGLSDSSKYNEANIVSKSSARIEGLNVDYGDKTKPTNGSTYFLYEINSDDFIKTNINNISVSVTDGEGYDIDGLLIDPIDPNNATDNTNGFKTIPLSFYYYSTNLDDKITGAKVEVTIKTSDASYLLTLDDVTIYPKAYILTLDGSGGIFNEKDSTIQIDIDKDINLNNLENKPSKTGYDLIGWYKDKECSEGNQVTSIELANVNSNITLYAKWTAVIKTVTFDRNDGSEDATFNNEVTYDSTGLDVISREGHTFIGWMDENGNLVTDSNGNVIDQDKLNSLILEDNSVLYAKWSDVNIIFKTQIENGDDQILAEGVASNGDTSVNVSIGDIDESYQLEGWYISDTKVLNSDGSIVENINVDGYITDGIFNVSVENTLALYAKWIHTKSAYVLKDSFEDGKKYLLATSNNVGTGMVMSSSFIEDVSGFKGLDVTIQSDLDDKKYIETNESNVLWAYNNSTLKMDNKYLYGNIEWYWAYKLSLSSSSSNWTYSNHKLNTSYRYEWSDRDVYICYQGSTFKATDYNWAHNYYSSDIYLYTLDDIRVETFKYISSITAQVSEQQEEIYVEQGENNFEESLSE